MREKLVVFGKPNQVITAGRMPVEVCFRRHQAVVRFYGVTVKIGYDQIRVVNN